MMEFKYTGLCFTILRAWMCHEVSKNISPSILSISLVINPDSFNLAFFVFLVLPFRSFCRADFTHRMPFSKKLTFPWEVFNWLGRWTTLCTHFHFHVSTPLATLKLQLSLFKDGKRNKTPDKYGNFVPFLFNWSRYL